MDPEELYIKSLLGKRPESDFRDSAKRTGVSTRAIQVLYRHDLLNDDLSINVEKLEQTIINGSIWTFRNCGEKTVRLLCEWVAAQHGVQPTADHASAIVTSETENVAGGGG